MSDVANLSSNDFRCPLCGSKDHQSEVAGQDEREYVKCGNCWMIYVTPEHHISPEEEKSRYMTHQNGIEYLGYVKFLNRAVKPALKYLKDGWRGLDFGCGHVPTLNILLEREGFTCDYYDLFFFPEIPAQNYDFIFATEVIEHFFDPGKEINQITNLLNSGGLLIIMTLLWKTESDLISHFYFRDTTHFVFYHEKTIRFLCKKYGLEILETDSERVVILRKK